MEHDLEQEVSQPRSGLGKRTQCDHDRGVGSAQQGTKRARTSEIIDLTHSSPAPQDAQEIADLLIDIQSSSPIEYGSGDEHSVSHNIDISNSKLTEVQPFH